MICPACRHAADEGQSHALCQGGTWCDCQHGKKMVFTPAADDERWRPTPESMTHG